MKQKNILNIVIMALTVILFSACGGGGGETEPTTDTTPVVTVPTPVTTVPPVTIIPPVVTVPTDTPPVTTTPSISSRYYGKWTYVDSGADINIISTTDLNVTEVANDDNLLKVHKDNTTYYLVRSSIPNTTVTGKIEAVLDANTTIARSLRASGYSGIGGINIILSHVLDEKIKGNHSAPS